MINHVTVKVKDFEKEEAFYEAALTPLGYGKGPAFPGVQAFVAEDGSAVWVSTACRGRCRRSDPCGVPGCRQ